MPRRRPPTWPRLISCCYPAEVCLPTEGASMKPLRLTGILAAVLLAVPSLARADDLLPADKPVEQVIDRGFRCAKGRNKRTCPPRSRRWHWPPRSRHRPCRSPPERGPGRRHPHSRGDTAARGCAPGHTPHPHALNTNPGLCPSRSSVLRERQRPGLHSIARRVRVRIRRRRGP